MKTLFLASAAALMLLTAAPAAQADQLYHRLPDGRFVLVVQLPAPQPLPVYYQPRHSYHHDRDRGWPGYYRETRWVQQPYVRYDRDRYGHCDRD